MQLKQNWIEIESNIHTQFKVNFLKFKSINQQKANAFEINRNKQNCYKQQIGFNKQGQMGEPNV